MGIHSCFIVKLVVFDKNFTLFCDWIGINKRFRFARNFLMSGLLEAAADNVVDRINRNEGVVVHLLDNAL